MKTVSELISLYSVGKERGSNRYYVYEVDKPNVPLSCRFTSKKKALKAAARMQGVTLKEYLRERKGR